MMIATAIEWKLKQLGKFDGCVVNTKDNVITDWNVNGVPKPDQATMSSWIVECQLGLNSEKEIRKNKKKAILQKLGLSEEELNDLLKD